MLVISAVWQSDSAMQAHILFYILFHYGLSQDIEYSRTLLFIQPIYNSWHWLIPSAQSPPPLLPLGNHRFVLMSVSVS